jgi:hypothetical protein
MMELKEWTEIKTGEIFKFVKPGDQLVGVLIGVRAGQFNNKAYDLEYKEKLYTLFGNTVLDDKMQKVSIGDIVRITFIGNKIGKESKRQYNDFKVEVAKNTK